MNLMKIHDSLQKLVFIPLFIMFFSGVATVLLMLAHYEIYKILFIITYFFGGVVLFMALCALFCLTYDSNK